MPRNSYLSNILNKDRPKKTIFKKKRHNDSRNTIFKNISMCLKSDTTDDLINDRRRIEGDFGWYQVTIMFVAEYDREFLFEKLQAHCKSIEFKAYVCKKIESKLTFYVDNFKLAAHIRTLSGKITLPDSREMIMRINPGIPEVDFNDNLKETLEHVLVKRYDNINKLLNLERFHSDRAFEERFCFILNPQVCERVFTLITNRIPDLIGLNLSNNNIGSFSSMAKFIKNFRHLSVLDISRNRINHLNELNIFKNLPITHLVLTGNPIEKKFRNEKTFFFSWMHRLFPKIVSLNRLNTPFEIGNVVKRLPTYLPTCLSCPDARTTIHLFLREYFKIYDSNNRDQLLNAYSNDCKFSITIAYRKDNVQSKPASLREYFESNRNLIRIKEPNRRRKNLKIGKLQTITQLKDLPKTIHNMSSFKVDMGAYTTEFFHLNVTGIFRETQSNVYRHFSKSMIMIPFGSGICIANELLHITNHDNDLISLI